MLLVADVAPSRRVPPPPGSEQLWGIEKLKVPRSTIPAVTHVDDSARIQTVRRHDNPMYYDIIRAFYELTGCPVIVNTSFNVRDEPIVCSLDDAYRCFQKTEMDVLVLENYIITKAATRGVYPLIENRTLEVAQRFSAAETGPAALKPCATSVLVQRGQATR
jgi:carbamoyltransferase